MKAVWFFKFLVFIFSFLLLVGFTFIAYKIAEQKKDGKIKTELISRQPDFSNINISLQVLDKNETIISSVSCLEDICLTVKNDFEGYRLIVINPQTGVLKKAIRLTQEAE